MLTEIIAQNETYTVKRHYIETYGTEEDVYYEVWHDGKVVQTFGSAIWAFEWIEQNMPDCVTSKAA